MQHHIKHFTVVPPGGYVNGDWCSWASKGSVYGPDITERSNSTDLLNASGTPIS